MQTFIDSSNQQQWAFDEDVIVTESSGVYSFADARGVPVETPTTLQPYMVPAPTAAEIARQEAVASAILAFSIGLTIVSTSTPTLNGTYAVDQLSQSDIIAIETSLNAGKGFPGGSTTFNYQDASGAMHAFSEVNFTNFASAIRDYVYALKSVVAGVTQTVPATTTTIA